MKITGTGVAIVTPLLGYRIDFASMGRVIDFVIRGGVEFIVPLGSTGEAPTLTEEEQRAVLDFTIKYVDNRVNIIAGNFGGNDTRALARKISSYNFHGIHAILSSSPSYNKPSQEGIYEHYNQLAQAGDIPIVVYNVPSRTASNIEAQTMIKMAHEIPQIVAVKEASTHMPQIKEIIDQKPDGFSVLSGDDPTTLEMMKMGGDGVISVIANALPEQFSKMIQACLNGDWNTATGLHNALAGIHPHLYVEGNPTGIKGALHYKGLCEKDVRLPLLPISNKAYAELVVAMI